MPNPKLFVSYSWTSPDHEDWVLELASELRASGVDVVFDKWDLKEGHDAHAFMEKMVTDSEIKKVILICDKAYVDKADGRSGGVGTEAQIMSAEIYEKQDQDKFVAIVKELNEQGKAYLPVYYKSRIYIDMGNPSVYAEKFDQLLRWIFNEPFYKKPEIGIKPSFLTQDENAVILSTSIHQKRAIEAIRKNKENAVPITAEYLTIFTSEIEKLRIKDDPDPFDEAVIKSMEMFVPYRNELIELFITLSMFLDNEESRSTLHKFFEQLYPYLHLPQNVTQYKELSFDNFRFIIHELFLYAVASLVKHERFESAAYLMSNDYYVADQTRYGSDVMVPYVNFHEYMYSLQNRNIRLELNRLSLRSDLLNQRCTGVGIQFRYIMQADFILYLRDYLDRPEEDWHWWPESLLYLNHGTGAFEIFARSKSSVYFNRVKVLLGIESKEELQSLLEDFRTEKIKLPMWGHHSFNPARLLGFNAIATKP